MSLNNNSLNEKIITIDNYINGKRSKSKKYLAGKDPSTGKEFLKIADSGKEEALEAVEAAVSAFPGWSETDINIRTKLLLRLADLLQDRLEEFSRAESRDQGKPIWLARTVDIPRAVHNLKIFANSFQNDMERCTYMKNQSALSYTRKEAVGVALLISPWNLPLYLLTFKMAPALITGNTIICKPSEFTSLTASMLCDLASQAGFPPGVINMVFGTGSGVGKYLVSDKRIRLISFTGSTATAEKIRENTVKLNKKLSLELGGKNAAIIFKDCDMEKAVKITIKSSFLNQGEVCLCTSRIFVHRDVINTFLSLFVEETKKLKVGNPKDPGNFLGALNNESHFRKVMGYIEMAKAGKEKGVVIQCGGEELNLEDEFKNGLFVRPHVITGVQDSSPFMQEEIFGPITCVVPFENEEEVIKRVNGTQYGLCATLWSENVNTVHRVAKQLQVGTVWANCWLVRDLRMPFGGVKDSGVGREGIMESLEFYTENKTICLQINA